MAFPSSSSKDASSPKFPEVESILQEKIEGPCAKPMPMSLDFLKSITRDFEQELGKGGFGVVYKGVLPNGKPIAVKKLYDMHLESDQFHKEVTFLTGLEHENIVQLMGYCDELRADKLIAVSEKLVIAYERYSLICYEYLTNKSLDKHLSAESSGLEWDIRYEIIKGICCGLHYLHNECHIVHLDLKPANILMDGNMVPKIADFGISRLFGQESGIITTNCRGTFGYMAPEYIHRGLISTKSDIFSLGVIIIELLIGSRDYPQSTEGSFGHFIENVVNRWRNEFKKSSKYINLEIYCEQVNACIEIGMKCVHPDPKKRPDVWDIIEMLNAAESKDMCSGVDGSGEVLDKSWPSPRPSSGQSSPSPSSGQSLASSGQLPSVLPYETANVCESIPKRKSAIGALLATSAHVFHVLLGGGRRTKKIYEKNGGRILETVSNIKLFNKKELKPILNSYNIIGRGAFGEVIYKGQLYNIQVTVKKAAINLDEKTKGQFVNEVIIQSRMIHRNIVKLIGCCLEDDAPILVYEFISKGSLKDILHGDMNEPLNLDQRLRIAAETAEGLAYMHSQTSTIILHGDVKPANILLNDEFIPKISDFGISRMIAIDKAKHTDCVIGDMNYIDPVYMRSGLLTTKSDVYSFGVVLLELISRKTVKYADHKSLVISFLLAHHIQSGTTELFDQEIITTATDIEFLECLAGIAVECLDYDVDRRPEMKDVAERLLMLRRSRDK